MIAFDVRHYDSIGSTNDEALRLARDGAPHGTVVCAREQTAGRGRHARRWHSPIAELDRQLNGRLIAVLRVLAAAVREFGRLDETAANLETVATASHLVGILLMDKSGRLKTLGFAGETLVDHAIGVLVERLRERNI